MGEADLFGVAAALVLTGVFSVAFKSAILARWQIVSLFVFGVAGILCGLALSGFLMERTALDQGPINYIVLALGLSLPAQAAYLAGFGYRRLYRVTPVVSVAFFALVLSGIEAFTPSTNEMKIVWFGYLYQALSFFFIVHGLTGIWREKADDMDVLRRKFRYVLCLIFPVALLVPILTSPLSSLWVEAFGVLWITIALAIGAARLQSAARNFEDYEEKKEEIVQLFERRRLYREDDLTLERIGDRLMLENNQTRVLIQRGLGYRRLSDLLDGYRVNAAKDILADIDQATSQLEEVAISVGYSTLPPFLEAFERLSGQTPMVFRRYHLDKADANRPLQLTNSDR
jgi:AraC-like DNA-binding protein/uncharacterized membrane protein